MSRGMSQGMRDVAAIVLAAGRGTRFGPAPKLLAQLGGKPLVRHVVEAACLSVADPVIGAPETEPERAADRAEGGQEGVDEGVGDGHAPTIPPFQIHSDSDRRPDRRFTASNRKTTSRHNSDHSSSPVITPRQK